MHELSREIPGKLEVRLSYNLVNDTKDSKQNLKKVVAGMCRSDKRRKGRISTTHHPSIIREILTMFTKKKFPVMNLPWG